MKQSKRATVVNLTWMTMNFGLIISLTIVHCESMKWTSGQTSNFSFLKRIHLTRSMTSVSFTIVDG